jgi:hypothetical protein
LWHFIKQRPLLPCIFFSGIAVVASAVSFTILLSAQTLMCPTWALDCTVHPWVIYIDNNLPLFQGIVSTIHGIGLALLAYPLFIFAEAVIWPILASEPYTLKSIDLYLSASRGSVPSLIQLVFKGRASIIMLWVGIVTILLQLDMDRPISSLKTQPTTPAPTGQEQASVFHLFSRIHLHQYQGLSLKQQASTLLGHGIRPRNRYLRSETL